MKTFLFLVLIALMPPVQAAPKSVTVTFTSPTMGDAPTGYRFFKDTVLVGPVVSGQTFANLLPGPGTYVLGVEAFNTFGTGARANKTFVVPGAVPGAVINFNITSPCLSETPPCTITTTVSP